jgi:sialate O-acetylesterase
MKTINDVLLRITTVRCFTLFILLSLSAASTEAAEEWKSVLDLRGKWKFEVGDDENRASVTYNDSKWGEIFVPSPWEDEGYPGYDGYAWYRKHFRLPADAGKKTLLLRLGCVDDVSEIYFNGTIIGIIGGFPPDFKSAYNKEVILTVPRNCLNLSGDNVIAVRVYDDQLAGGIVQGKIGLYESSTFLSPEIALAGMWKFQRGDSERWKDPSLDDSQWNKIFVPAFWESQGNHRYDGMAWYRMHVRIPAELASKDLVLLLGKIDDLDETYVNGNEVGHTGRIRFNPQQSSHDQEYTTLRAYPLLAGVLRTDTENIIAVRVYDAVGEGGIYEGPVGITTRERYAEWKKNVPWKVKARDKADDFFKWLFQ